MTRALTLLSLSLAALASSPAEELRYTPGAETALRTTYESEARLELISLEMTVDGAAHGGMPVPELSFEVRSQHAFLDRYEEVADGRPTRLARTYEELSETSVRRSISAHDGAEETTREAESDLEGRTVVFRWDAGDEEYGAEFEDGEGDSALLEGLEARLDLASFLPADEVSEGDSWDVPAEAFRALLEPGGDLHLSAEDEESESADDTPQEELEGSIRATLRGTREEGGLTLAVIALEAEVSVSRQRPLEEGSGEESSVEELEVSGELTWLPAAGRLHALELSGELRARNDKRRDVDMGDQRFEVREMTELAGEMSIRLRVEPQ